MLWGTVWVIQCFSFLKQTAWEKVSMLITTFPFWQKQVDCKSNLTDESFVGRWGSWEGHFVRRSVQYAHPSRTSPTDVSKEGTSQLIQPAAASSPQPPQPILILIVSRLFSNIQKGTVLICQCCHKEVPHIEWLKQQKCIIWVLGAGSLRSKCQLVASLWVLWGKILSMPLF